MTGSSRLWAVDFPPGRHLPGPHSQEWSAQEAAAADASLLVKDVIILQNGEIYRPCVTAESKQ